MATLLYLVLHIQFEIKKKSYLVTPQNSLDLGQGAMEREKLQKDTWGKNKS